MNCNMYMYASIYIYISPKNGRFHWESERSNCCSSWNCTYPITSISIIKQNITNHDKPIFPVDSWKCKLTPLDWQGRGRKDAQKTSFQSMRLSAWCMTRSLPWPR